jgi:hypothetical protein
MGGKRRKAGIGRARQTGAASDQGIERGAIAAGPFPT